MSGVGRGLFTDGVNFLCLLLLVTSDDSGDHTTRGDEERAQDPQCRGKQQSFKLGRPPGRGVNQTLVFMDTSL